MSRTKAQSRTASLTARITWFALFSAIWVMLVVSGVAVAEGPITYFAQSQDPAEPAYRPGDLQVAGEGSFIVQKMHWSIWNERVVRGRGIGAQDDCEPDCATGTYHRAPARIRLWRPRRKCGNRIWTRMTLIWVHGPPRVPGESTNRRVLWKLGQFPCE
jgi:hypothetical protein